jgi:hypothetical protein
MMRNVLSDVRFENGICLVRRTPGLAGGEPRLRRDWHIIGRLDDDTPFLLEYSQAVTNWVCSETLGAALRRKILGKLREDIRRSQEIPEFIVTHDLTAFDDASIDLAASNAGVIVAAFFRDIWRERYLDDRDEDYVALSVPFAEKDAAKALGAKWDAENRIWRVRKQDDMEPFARWLPETSSPEDPANFQRLR